MNEIRIEICDARFRRMLREDVTFKDWEDFRAYYERLPEDIAKKKRLDFLFVVRHLASALPHEKVYQDDILIHAITGEWDQIGR